MANYTDRGSELRDLLTQATVGADERVTRALREAIERYMDMRQRALDDLVDIIAKASFGNLGTQEKWQSRIARLREDYSRLFGDSVKDLMLPPPLQLFWFATLQAEETFFEKLSKVGTPKLLEDILKHQDGLSKLIAELQDSWKFVLSNDQALENDEIRAIREVDAMVQAVMSDLDQWTKDLTDSAGRATEATKRAAENLKTRVKDALGPVAPWLDAASEAAKKLIVDSIKPDGLGDDFDVQSEAITQRLKLAAQALVERARIYKSLVQTYQSLVSTEKGGVLTMFKKTKEEVDRCINDNNVSKAKEWLDQARGQLADWSSSLPTSRQQSDASTFREEVRKLLESDWKITEELDKKFREQFQGVFLSPLSNETVEQLAERYLFEQHLQTINGRRGDAKLEDYRRQLSVYSESVDNAMRPMTDAVDSLPAEVQELAKMRNKDFQEYVRTRIKRQVDELLPSIQDLKNMLDAANVSRDFSRAELESMLR